MVTKKTLLLASMVAIVGLSSCGQQDVKNPSSKINPNTKSNIIDLKKDKQEEEKIVKNTINISEEEITKQRYDISMDDINNNFYKIFSGKKAEGKNKVEKAGIKFLTEIASSDETKLTDNINGGISEKTLKKAISSVDDKLVRKMKLSLNISSLTKEVIKSGTVYVNGINLGKFTNGKFKKEFPWVKGIEIFNIIVRADGYGDGILKMNSINSKGKLLSNNIILKKASFKEIDLSKETELSTKDMKIKLNKCSLVDNVGRCYKEKAKVRLNFISGNEANTGKVSLIRNYITQKGELGNSLDSGGMTYIDFIANNGEILKVGKGKTVNITYNITKKDIDLMKNRKGLTKEEAKKDEEETGYWYFNKNTGLREQDTVENKFDTKNLTWTATVSRIY